MLLTIPTTHRPATDLGFLLHKNPARPQSFDLSFGRAHVVYPEAGDDRCTAALILDIDPVGLVRGRRGPAAGRPPQAPRRHGQPIHGGVAPLLLAGDVGRRPQARAVSRARRRRCAPHDEGPSVAPGPDWFTVRGGRVSRAVLDICGSSTVLNTRCPSTWIACATAACRPSVASRFGSLRWVSKGSSDSSAVNRSVACTNVCSASSRWRASPSILGSRLIATKTP